MFESGLIDEWKMRTWMRMKTESNEGQTELDSARAQGNPIVILGRLRAVHTEEKRNPKMVQI